MLTSECTKKTQRIKMGKEKKKKYHKTSFIATG